MLLHFVELLTVLVHLLVDIVSSNSRYRKSDSMQDFRALSDIHRIKISYHVTVYWLEI